MYLKSIEVNGFKSFAHKMIFKFEDGITGIVGPNGSGKSNVADAVRWVLGEQSAKQLRGAKMEDVIFSGTQLRKPMGSAYVAITMDNSDGSLPVQFSEVTVARRVYRSGESEYLMNGSPCRRKDIVELFFDTGVGKEGYSIIGQGQIDQILSGKPEDRRELFDEAAGIVKYKKNQEQTQKSLDAERENLLRVTDILTELERQTGPLMRQSQKAKEYLKFRDQLKEKDVKLFLLENENFTKNLEELEKKIKIAGDELQKANANMEYAKEKYEAEEKILNEMQTLVSKLTGEVSEAKVAKEKQEGEIKVLQEQIHTEKTKEEHFDANRERLEQGIKEKRLQMEEIRKEIKLLQISCKDAENERIEKESCLAFYQKEMQDVSEELKALREQIQAYGDSQLTVAGQLERFQTVEEQLNVRIGSLNRQKEELKLQIKDAGKKQTILENEILHLKEQEQETDIQARNAQRIVGALMEERQEISGKLSTQKEKYHRMQSNYETLRNMAERYDGYGYGLKKVMEQRYRCAGIIGTVADIIKVEQRYEAALETALGGSIQNIVVDTQQTAKEMIDFLKKNRYGRVTFLPLDAVRGKQFSQSSVLKEPGVIGPADKLAEFDQRYRDLFAFLLGQVLVVENMDAGIAIANKYHHSIRIVTLEGDAINRGGSMSGGAYKNKGNLLGRNREVKELEGKISDISEKILRTEKKLEENSKKSEEFQQAVIKLNKQRQNITLDQNTKEMSLAAYAGREEDFRERISRLEEQTEALKKEKDSARDDAMTLIDQKSDLDLANRTDEQKVQELEKKLEHTRELANRQADIISDIHMKVGEQQQKLEFVQSNGDRVRFELEKQEEELEHNLRFYGQIGEAVQKISDEIESKKEDILKKERDISEKSKQLTDLHDSMEEKNAIYKKTMEERQELMERAGGYDKEMFRLTAMKEKQQEKQQELLDYMWENYEITYHQAKSRMTENINESLTQIKKEISEIKGNIRELGPVNVNAIEDYKEVSERYEFMKQQHEDIVKAEEHLSGLMKELEEAMRRQFDEKFRDIQKMFQTVFVELFGGGTARLELTDDDVLESGIRIIAQPPGKKLQNMMQLSGGEKALTAIALLFAIQNLKPSPFCLLDEIEAALDDSNVTRFAKYLHKLTKDTQFIVITHRRGTMMAADVLYGITMQEKGVSTQVSVNLIENALDE